MVVAVLPADRRLRDGETFRRTVRRGRRGATRSLVVHVDPSPASAEGPTQVAQVGLVVSRAVGNAVTRNRVKRRLRHLLSARLGDLPEHGAIVVRALPSAADLSSSELDAEVTRCLERARRGRLTGSAT